MLGPTHQGMMWSFPVGYAGGWRVEVLLRKLHDLDCSEEEGLGLGRSLESFHIGCARPSGPRTDPLAGVLRALLALLALAGRPGISLEACFLDWRSTVDLPGRNTRLVHDKDPRGVIPGPLGTVCHPEPDRLVLVWTSGLECSTHCLTF